MKMTRHHCTVYQARHIHNAQMGKAVNIELVQLKTYPRKKHLHIIN